MNEAQGHYVELVIEGNELHRNFRCTMPPNAACRRRPKDREGRESWTKEEATEPGFECWAAGWVEAVGIEGAIWCGEDQVLASVPVSIAYSECVEIATCRAAGLLGGDPAEEWIELAAEAGYEVILENSGARAFMGRWDEQAESYRDFLRAQARAILAAAPVVDEAKLVQVIARHRVTAGRPGLATECLCGWRSSIRDPGHPAHLARAILEELRGGER